jgi:hypothetical protein
VGYPGWKTEAWPAAGERREAKDLMTPQMLQGIGAVLGGLAAVLVSGGGSPKLE